MLKHFGKVAVVLFFGFLLFSMPSTGSAIPSVAFQPMDQTVNLGDSASVEVWVMSPDDYTEIQFVDIWVMYDASIITFNTLAFGNPDALEYSDTTGSPEESEPSSNIWMMHLDADTGESANLDADYDSFLLATLNFNAVGSGTSALSFADAFGMGANDECADAECDGFIRDWFLADGQYFIPLGQVNPGSITVAGATSVPEPGTALLLGLGLAALASLKKKII